MKHKILPTLLSLFLLTACNDGTVPPIEEPTETGGTSGATNRGTVNYPPEADAGYKLWYYPTTFAIDFDAAHGTDNLWLVDYENKGNWLMTGVWKSTNRGATWTKNNNPPLQENARSVVIDPKDSSQLIYTYFGGGMLRGMNPSY